MSTVFPAAYSNITEVVVSEGVTSIGTNVFSGCTGLASVTIPNSVTNIGSQAFSGCNGLAAVYISDLAAWCGISFGNDSANPLYSAKHLYLDGEELSGDLVIPDGVTNIGIDAFYSCTNLTSVTIPDSVARIESGAFAGCDGLTGVTIPNSVTSIGNYAFSNCSNLTSMPIGNNVTNIGYGAFSGCNGLRSVIIPQSICSSGMSTIFPNAYNKITDAVICEGVTSIESYAFNGCNGLTNVVIPDSVTSIGENAFYFCYRLKSVTVLGNITNDWNPVHYYYGGDTIYKHPFNGCTNVETVVLGGNMTKIGSYMFYLCSNLASVTIGDGVTSIGAAAFSGCSNLVSVNIHDLAAWCGISFGNESANPLHYAKHLYLDGEEVSLIGDFAIPDGVTRIGSYLFYGCTNLTSVATPDSVASIGDSAFSGCSGLTSVTIPNSVTNIGGGAFRDCTGLASVTIPDGVTSIENSTFCNCSGLTSVTIGNSVTSIGDSAFSGCSGLTSVTIPNSVTNIGNYAFRNCTGLAGMTIPNSVTSIGEYAFSNCTGLRLLCVPAAWEGTSRLANAGVPSGCRVVYAEMEPVDGVTWAYTTAGGQATVAGASRSGGVLAIPSTLGGLPVTGIGSNAFRFCTGFAAVDIPACVTNIAPNAFSGCTGLTSATIPQSICSSRLRTIFPDAYATLSEVAVRDGVTAIGAYAFSGCAGLATLSIPDSVTNIGANAFSGCTGLQSVTISQCICSSRLSTVFPDAYAKLSEVAICPGTTNIGEQVFAGCVGLSSVTIPESVESIGACAFDGCVSLETVTIPAGVTRIEEGTFRGCAGMQSVGIPESMTYVGDRAFAGCTGLAGVTIPDGVTYIGDEAFAGCTALSEVVVPDGVETIGDDAFQGCDALASIHLPESLVDWGLRSLPPAMQAGLEYGVDGFLILNNWVLGHRNPEVSTLAVPAGIVGIGNHALADFWDLETVELPDSLKYIGRGTFETDTYLDNLVIPDSVERIGDRAFRQCTYLHNLTIGESVARIGREAFATCSQLATLAIPDSVIEVGDAAFSNCWRLLSAKLPMGLETAGTGMFAGCRSLTGVTMPTHGFTLARLFEDRYAAIEAVTVAAGETMICSLAFHGCSALSSVTLPASLESIGEAAFLNCWALAGIELPETLTEIGGGAFEGCSGLAAVVLPDSVGELGAGAFRNCTALANVTLSRSLDTLPDYVFEGCWSLSSMVVPASVRTLGKGIGEWFQSLYYLGNAPAYDAGAYSPRSWSITTYVVQGTRGWDGIPSSRDLPDSWIGYPITFWEPNRFDATFDANGGTFPDGAAAYACEQITDVAYALPPYEPALEGAAFDGWWTDPAEGAQIKATTRVNETREITFYAHWKGSPVPVTVRFNANGGTVVPDEGSYQATMPYGELPVPTREYYRFTGWWTKAVGGNKIVASSRVPGADQELFAHWTPETYAIRFHANGGTGTMADQSFTYGSPVTLRANAFRREDWLFAGWALSEDGAVAYADRASFPGMAAIQDGVIHLYAVWWQDGGRYAVRFDSNGGTGQMDNQTFAIGEAQALSPCLFSREWFRFAGWALAPGGAVAYADGETVKDLTTQPNAAVSLYAVWTVAETATGVPHSWLASYGLGGGTAADCEAAANAMAANGIYTVRECYVAGLDPTDESAKFTAEIALDGNGIPEVQSVDPDLGEERNYTLQGKKDLMDEDWTDMAIVPESEKDEYRFFCVGVALHGE
jgi:uncharacterized repeat protein (TIGR02543 family)